MSVPTQRSVSLGEYVEEAVRRAQIVCEADGCTATVAELPGCITSGATPSEAMEHLRDAVEAWVLTAIRFGDPVPPLGDVVLAYTA
ncbi:MAG: type II toxin-antitoxin system HicB family antitoxin [Fimbriimonadales bacterium]|nr:type II toxin-antitoxin system HicB family antitoxin [Fimbriimonadales bacterium]